MSEVKLSRDLAVILVGYQEHQGTTKNHLWKRLCAGLAKCRQILVFSMPVVFTGKYRQILAFTGKYWQIQIDWNL